MYSRILVGVDGRTGGQDAIALARVIAGPDADVVLVNVWETLDGVAAAALGAEPPVNVGHALLEDARRTLDRPCRVLTQQAVTAPAGLHRAAEEQGADLLVVGSCSRQGAGRALLGDETRATLHGARCAIAVAPRGFARHADALSRIGVGYEATPEGDAALDAARIIAAEQGAPLHATVVLEARPATWALAAGAYADVVDSVGAEIARRAQADLEGLGDLVGHVRWGAPARELVAVSRHLDLLVVGSHGRGPVGRLVLGSTADALVRDATCAVLVVTRTSAPQAAEPAGAAALSGA